MREDWMWIAPAVILAYIQVKFVWGSMPKYKESETEIPGSTIPEMISFLIFYNLIRGIFVIQWAINIFPIVDNIYSVYLRIIGYIFFVFGLTIAIISLYKLGNNWTAMIGYRIKKNQLLVTNGIYRYIRHPIYLTMILQIIGYELIVNSWLLIPTTILMIILICRHISKEDKLLELKFKDEFVKYKDTVASLIPGIY